MPKSQAQKKAGILYSRKKAELKKSLHSQTNTSKPTTAIRDDLPLPPNPKKQKKEKTSQASRVPPGELMDAIYQLLYDYNFTSAVQSLRAHNQKRPGFDYHAYVNSAKGYPPLLDVWLQWEKDHPESFTKGLHRAAAVNGEVSTDSDDSSDEDSDESSESDSDATAEPMDIDTKAEAATVESSDDSEDDSEDSSDESESEDEVAAPKASLKAASPDSSDDEDSSDDSSSDEEDVTTAKKTPLPDSDSSDSNSSSDDSSDDSEDAVEAAAAKSTDDSSEDSSSSSDSDDSDDSEADLAKKTAAVPAAAVKPAAAAAPSSKKRKAEAEVEEDTEAGGIMNGERAKRMKEGVERFSRIPKDIKIDPRFASNKYQSYDYADNAHAKLIITKGKGFTKAKNKGKKGSYRGGMIDTGMQRGVMFDD